MMIDVFTFDGEDIHLNQPEVLLITEFEQLWKNTDWGKCKEDKSGKKHIKATKVFKYLWLAHDFKSPYMELTPGERSETALKDTGLDESDLEHGMVKVAIHKYKKLQETRTLKLLETANNTIDKIRDFLDDIDLKEKDTNNDKYMHSTKDILNQLTQLGSVSSSLKDLQYTVQKEREAEKSLRGDDTEPGLFD